MQCARHPQRETFVRCGRCEQPICPDCMVSAPVGVRCRDCSRQNLDAIMKGSPKQYALGALCGFGSGFALGLMPHTLPWLGMIYGYLVGEATLRGGGRKRGLGMQIIAGLAAAAGFLVWAMPHSQAELLALLTSPWELVGLGLGVFFSVMHVRYI
jgi:thiol:disulfide interchange protein